MTTALIEQLANQVEDLTACLEAKEVDLETAAKFGSALLEENKKLQSEVKSLKDAAVVKVDADSRLAALETAHQDLIYQLQRLEKENEEQAAVIASQQGAAKRNFEQDLGLESEVKELQSQVLKLKTDNEKLGREGEERVNHIEVLSKSLKISSIEEESLKIQVKGLEEQNGSIDLERVSALEAVEILKAKVDALNLKIVELEASVDEYQNYKVTAEEQLMTIEQLSVELEWLRETNIKLAHQVSMTSTLDSKDIDGGGGKTLLNEIEDRRLELIKEHQTLAEKHAGLSQTHSASLYRQQKMQHHISRLSQLSNTDFSQEKVRLLEEQLAQTESEKIELEKRIETMQSKTYQRTYSWEEADTVNGEPIRDLARIETLEFRIQTLIEECETLKKENHKIRLVKAGETDKLHQITTVLLDKERELDDAKHALANTKFELDELQLSIREAQNPIAFEVEELAGLGKENDPVSKDAILNAAEASKKDAIPIFKPHTNNTAVKTVKLDRSTVKEELTNTIVAKTDGPATKDVDGKKPELAPISEKSATEDSPAKLKEVSPGNTSTDKIASGDKVASKKGKAASAKPKE